MVLNIEADDYLSEFSESYGAIVDVTGRRDMHFPEENGYLVAPGQVTNIGFTKVSLVMAICRLVKHSGVNGYSQGIPKY